MASSKAAPTVPATADNSDSPIELLSTARPSQTSGINRLPVELLHMIAWSLPSANVNPKSLGYWARGAWDEQEKDTISLPPRPQDLYPLAKTCKGFWQCLSPLLYHFDVTFWTAVFKPISDDPDHFHTSEDRLVESPFLHSALSWGIGNNEMAAVKMAVGAARAVGDLEVYAGITRNRGITYHHDLLGPNPWDNFRVANVPCWEPAGAVGYADALFQAVLHGNSAAVELLTEDADASILNRPMHQNNFDDPSWLSHIHGDCPTNMALTILNFAISLRHADIVQVLLTRYSQLDQSTLEWYQPSALSIAASLGDVDMARLILDGTSSHSPWVARARSQLLDPRAYLHFETGDDTSHYATYGIPRPPMVMAGMNMFRAGWCENGDEIFSFLAERGGRDLLTQDSRWASTSHTADFRTPLECALVESHGADLPVRASPQPLPDDSRVVELIKCGALNTRSFSKFPEVTPRVPGVFAIERLWGWFWLDSSARVDFMGRCWDAALHNHDELDEAFVSFWVAGASRILCEFQPLSPIRRFRRPLSQDIEELETHVALISLLESKAPGFVQHPPIRAWLDRFVFQRSSRREINHTNLKGNWRHLM